MENKSLSKDLQKGKSESAGTKHLVRALPVAHSSSVAGSVRMNRTQISSSSSAEGRRPLMVKQPSNFVSAAAGGAQKLESAPASESVQVTSVQARMSHARGRGSAIAGIGLLTSTCA